MDREKKIHIHFTGKHLGSVDFTHQDFPEELYKEIEDSQFRKLSVFDKHEKANQILFKAISEAEKGTFLLPKIVTFISRLREELPTYNIGSFEFWLNHFSGVTTEQQSVIRGKIVGKYIPRMSYQKFFPLGMGIKHAGPHFSFAHYSPDLDTTVASFHCFLAAFGCQVAESRHHWVVPGGPPQGSLEVDFLFKKALGADVFKVLSKADRHVQISSLDLLTQNNIEKKSLSDLFYDVDHARSRKAIILVQENGCYLGDWRQMDVDPVRAIISRFWRMMIEHQNTFHIGLISLFAKKALKQEDLKTFLHNILKKNFADCNCTAEFLSEHRKLLDKFLKEVVGAKSGFSCSYDDLVTALSKQFGLRELREELTALLEMPFFNEKGMVIDDRSVIFKELEKVITSQKEAYKKLLRYFDTLDVALKIKKKVLGLEPNYLSHLADLDQIQKQMGDYSHLTVNYKEGETLFPLGVIHSADLKKATLASASWNDFSNPNETDSRPEIEVISYIDHHKSDIKTGKPSLGIVMDAQSSNSIYANLLMEINDQYSSGGMSLEQIEAQIKEGLVDLNTPARVRVMQRLLQKKDALLKNKKTDYYVSVDREILEYLQSVFAILDDTDLLTKVTDYDVRAMCALINRLKSLMMKKEVEVVNFDDILLSDPHFVKKAAKKLLQTHDLYSLYSIIYKAKEKLIEEIVADTLRGHDTPFFQDTKVLNEYACVGQFKHFINNSPTLLKKGAELRKIWINRCRAMHKDHADLTLFIFMLSTISSADELFADKIENPTYKDELWFWIPDENESSEALLKKFISNFTHSSFLEGEDLEIHFCGKGSEFEKMCGDAIVRPFEKNFHRSEPSCVVFKVPQKKIVSRKAQISPYL